MPRPARFAYGEPLRLGTVAENHAVFRRARVALTAGALLALEAPEYARDTVGLEHAGLRCLTAAVLRDLAGHSAQQVADQGYADAAAARRAIRKGRERWAHLGAWPWWHFGLVAPDPEWHQRRDVAATWAVWLATAA